MKKIKQALEKMQKSVLANYNFANGIVKEIDKGGFKVDNIVNMRADVESLDKIKNLMCEALEETEILLTRNEKVLREAQREMANQEKKRNEILRKTQQN